MSLALKETSIAVVNGSNSLYLHGAEGKFEVRVTATAEPEIVTAKELFQMLGRDARHFNLHSTATIEPIGGSYMVYDLGSSDIDNKNADSAIGPKFTNQAVTIDSAIQSIDGLGGKGKIQVKAYDSDNEVNYDVVINLDTMTYPFQLVRETADDRVIVRTLGDSFLAYDSVAV